MSCLGWRDAVVQAAALGAASSALLRAQPCSLGSPARLGVTRAPFPRAGYVFTSISCTSTQSCASSCRMQPSR